AWASSIRRWRPAFIATSRPSASGWTATPRCSRRSSGSIRWRCSSPGRSAARRRRPVPTCGGCSAGRAPAQLPTPASPRRPQTGLAGEQLARTAVSQPLLFAVELALAELWREWGIEPQAMLGYSLGEYVAACVAGVFSAEDALRLVAERARRIDALPAGAML